MRYFTVCSGVDAVSLAWEPLGFVPVGFSEISEFPKAVLAHHWPHVTDHGDLTTINGKLFENEVDILWGSTPCQAFAVSGRRLGLNDPRGALTMSFVNLADDMNPDFVVWENVKGVFSDQTNAFGCFLGALAGEDVPLVPAGGKWTHAGYVLGPKRAVAWRLFDAQFGGVAQRRQRVFVVACPRDGADPREILFERGGSRRDIAPLYPEQQGHALGVGSSSEEPQQLSELTLPCYINTDARPKISTNHIYPLKADQGSGGRGSIAQIIKVGDELRAIVRRLTPEECERLMGMPEGHTRIPWNGKPASECPDIPRWHALGNSLAVTDVRWIGERILAAKEGRLETFEWPDPQSEGHPSDGFFDFG